MAFQGGKCHKDPRVGTKQCDGNRTKWSSGARSTESDCGVCSWPW